MDEFQFFPFIRSLENPKYPLLGPNVWGLYTFGLYQIGSKIHSRAFNIIYILIHLFIIFVHFMEIYVARHEIFTVFFNIPTMAVDLITIYKLWYFILNLPNWIKLVNNISEEEILQRNQNDPKINILMMGYTKYSRIVTYGCFILIMSTIMIRIAAPLLKYLAAPVYREMVKNGTEPYPQIFLTYLPFDNTTKIGYTISIIMEIMMLSFGGPVISFYDSTAFTIMAFFKGYMKMLKVKCERIFGEQTSIPKQKILSNIRECHRMHNFFIEQHNLFNDLVSPVMFSYVLVCSMAICFSVIQMNTGEEMTLVEKFWILNFAFALIFQLFLYCWHSNEIMYESLNLSQGVYNSNWWRADVQEKKELLLLGGKLSPSYIIDAGPFTSFSVATFINIMKGAYSFYTLFIHMKDK